MSNPIYVLAMAKIDEMLKDLTEQKKKAMTEIKKKADTITKVK
jgi:hypothetical protein